MKIAFATVGSRGDIQPILVLALLFKKHLQQKNKECEFVFVTHRNQQKWIESYGFNFEPITICIDEVAQKPEVAELIVKGQTLKFSQAVMTKEGMESIGMDLFKGCEGCDMVVTSGTTTINMLHIAEKYNAKLVVVSLGEMHPTSESLPLFQGSAPFGFINRFGHFAFRKLMWSTCKDMVNGFRKRLDLPTISEQEYHTRADALPCFCAYSPYISPKPHDFPDNVLVGGFLFMETNGRLVDELESFLTSKTNVVYIGFGSMPAQVTTKFWHLVNQVVDQAPTDWNFIIYIGSTKTGFENLKSNTKVFLLTGAPHDLLFPRCDVVVHHGGAGTTASAFKAGRPQVICAFFADQPFWARKIAALGVGPKSPLSFSTTTAKELVPAIKEVMELTCVEKAKQIRDIVLKEQQESKAVDWLYNCFFPEPIDSA
ncbi:hypothetical protein HDV02_001888 [Globomyces sp. JEL0801]|nr:hypothetical protein HDV02_001888 [Globomyces sp. JEL0801]